jgi:hypothetical protein
MCVQVDRSNGQPLFNNTLLPVLNSIFYPF